jgi:hypothetical protein
MIAVLGELERKLRVAMLKFRSTSSGGTDDAVGRGEKFDS